MPILDDEELLSPFIWLDAGMIASINEAVVNATSEPHAILKPDMLESSAAAPANLFFYEGVDDALILGIHLMVSLARNHAFTQGNKRTAFQAMVVFLDANGHMLDVPDTVELAEQIEGVMLGRVPKEDLIEALRPHCTAGDNIEGKLAVLTRR